MSCNIPSPPPTPPDSWTAREAARAGRTLKSGDFEKVWLECRRITRNMYSCWRCRCAPTEMTGRLREARRERRRHRWQRRRREQPCCSRSCNCCKLSWRTRRASEASAGAAFCRGRTSPIARAAAAAPPPPPRRLLSRRPTLLELRRRLLSLRRPTSLLLSRAALPKKWPASGAAATPWAPLKGWIPVSMLHQIAFSGATPEHQTPVVHAQPRAQPSSRPQTQGHHHPTSSSKSTPGGQAALGKAADKTPAAQKQEPPAPHVGSLKQEESRGLSTGGQRPLCRIQDGRRRRRR
ncbi:uncharacterized protein LOC119592473 [Penaeus monodon]|uniref:uncharacterized protein LOC119592473 n=1 Tax=Penaeus monodon TaxID=6687 RepID=UPI0018A712CB|nr:uncharacterized protein LOC119592473 [Penaeus monodon]